MHIILTICRRTLLLLLLLFAPAELLRAASVHSLYDIDKIDVGTASVWAGDAINNAGLIGLNGTFQDRGHFWENGALTSVGSLGGSYSFIHDINDSGVMTGVARAPSGERAFRYQNGVMTNLGALNGQSVNNSIGYGINSSGQVAGVTEFLIREGTDDEEQVLRAVVYNANGTKRNLGTLGGTDSWAYDINDHGHVAGWAGNSDDESRGFVFKNGQMFDAGISGSEVEVYAINNHDDLVGRSNFETGFCPDQLRGDAVGGIGTRNYSQGHQ